VKQFGTRGGNIINIASTAVSMSMPTTSLYTSTKAAVESLTRVHSKELGPRKIRVNTISPGGVETEGVHDLGILGTDFEKQMIAQTPLGRMGQPGDIAPIAVFLASDDSGWLTGETLSVSGGLR
jgi:3-oxoacyl-[acyl-carrier protein] reductase